MDCCVDILLGVMLVFVVCIRHLIMWVIVGIDFELLCVVYVSRFVLLFIGLHEQVWDLRQLLF